MTENGLSETPTAEQAVENGDPTNSHGRRAFLRTATMGAATVGALIASSGLAAPAFARTTSSSAGSGMKLVDAGAGMHVGQDTMQMLSPFTVSRSLVTCAVAQMGLTSDMVAALKPVLGAAFGSGFSGPFAMEMYSFNVTQYSVDRASKTITAKGTLRSITKIGGATIEDANSPYLCVAHDNKAKGSPDDFFLSFKTPFWSPSSNPLATPSQYVKGWAQFGNEAIIGEVTVA